MLAFAESLAIFAGGAFASAGEIVEFSDRRKFLHLMEGGVDRD
jgi:hypothetical protein